MQTDIICNYPLIFTIAEFLTPEECAAYLDASENSGYEEATVTTKQGAVMRKDVRNNLRLISDDPALAAKMFERARLFLPEEYRQRVLTGFNERWRYYRYDAGQTFKPHFDGSFERSATEASYLTFLLYLNEDFEGGETVFSDNRGEEFARIEPKQGMALIFAHNQLHEGAPVTSGRKYVLRTDVMYRASEEG